MFSEQMIRNVITIFIVYRCVLCVCVCFCVCGTQARAHTALISINSFSFWSIVRLGGLASERITEPHVLCTIRKCLCGCVCVCRYLYCWHYQCTYQIKRHVPLKFPPKNAPPTNRNRWAIAQISEIYSNCLHISLRVVHNSLKANAFAIKLLFW